MADTVGKRVQFDPETWQSLDVLARSRMMTFQELADEAFRDLLKKHDVPRDLRDAFRKSAAASRKINDNQPDKPDARQPAAKSTERRAAKSKRPAAKRRARR